MTLVSHKTTHFLQRSPWDFEKTSLVYGKKTQGIKL